MTRFEETENIYLKYFKKTLDKLGFEKYETSNFSEQGGWIKFKNDAFRLQILDDRGLIESEISPLFGQEQFRGIEAYNSLLALRNSTAEISGLKRQIILGTRLDFLAQAAFLADNFDDLKSLLDKKNYKTTLRDIGRLG